MYEIISVHTTKRATFCYTFIKYVVEFVDYVNKIYHTILITVDQFPVANEYFFLILKALILEFLH